MRSNPFGICRADVWRSRTGLVYRLANNGDVVAFKMGRRQGGPSRTGTSPNISYADLNRGRFFANWPIMSHFRQVHRAVDL